jgi:hypothetical protein
MVFGSRDDGDQNTEAASGINSVPPATGQWQQIVATSKGGSGTLFIDGKKVATGEVRWQKNSTPVTIGQDYIYSPNPQRCFKGDIDDIRIYSRALSAEEIKAIYELEKPKNTIDGSE